MDAYHIISLIYPDHGPVWFLLYMLGVIWFGLHISAKEYK
jgi:hypothetical protein